MWESPGRNWRNECARVVGVLSSWHMRTPCLSSSALAVRNCYRHARRGNKALSSQPSLKCCLVHFLSPAGTAAVCNAAVWHCRSMHCAPACRCTGSHVAFAVSCLGIWCYCTLAGAALRPSIAHWQLSTHGGGKGGKGRSCN